MTVKNYWGAEFNWEAAANLMDAEICEEIYNKYDLTEQEFFDRYCTAHEAKYGEEFELAKENPVW